MHDDFFPIHLIIRGAFQLTMSILTTVNEIAHENIRFNQSVTMYRQ